MISILFYDNVAILSFESNIGSRIPISTMPNNNTKIHKKLRPQKKGVPFSVITKYFQFCFIYLMILIIMQIRYPNIATKNSGSFV